MSFPGRHGHPFPQRVDAEWGFGILEADGTIRIEYLAGPKRDLLSKIAILARVPDRRRESFIARTALAIGYTLIVSETALAIRRWGSSRLFNAYGKVLAARNALAALSDQDRALIDIIAKPDSIFAQFRNRDFIRTAPPVSHRRRTRFTGAATCGGRRQSSVTRKL
jgi:hypothetical protein